jgi:LysM repeat protein
MAAAIDTAERERAASGGPQHARSGEVPHEVRPGETLTGISRTYGGRLPAVMSANPQIENPNRIRPGEIVFVPTHHPQTAETRRQVAEAEAADRSVASLEAIQRDPNATPGERKMAAMELPNARRYAGQQWGEVRKAVEADLRQGGAHATFPDVATQPLLAEIRNRVPESDGFQKAVDAALRTVDGEWRSQRTTRGQVDALVADARAADAAVASADAIARDPSASHADRKLARMDLPDLRREASTRWQAVEDAIARELRYAGGKGAFPDQAAAPTLQQLQVLPPGNPQFQKAIGGAVKSVDADWRGSTTTTGELAELANKAGDAERSLQSLEQLSRSANPGERKLALAKLPEARSYAAQQWAALRTELEGDIRAAGEGKPFPEEATAGFVAELKSRLPDDPKLRQTVDEAFTNITGEWRKQGWTRDRLGPVITKYETVEKAQANLDAAPGDPAQRADLPELQRALSTAQGALRVEIENQLRAAGDQVPPEQREGAITARALIISQNGPQEASFQDIVDLAHYNVVVQPRIDAVQHAYGTGGASAAAAELEKQTEGVTPETAERVVHGSMPVIDKIAADLGNTDPVGQSDGMEQLSTASQTYRDLAIAVDRAARSNDGPQVARVVADSLAVHLVSGDVGPRFIPVFVRDAVAQGEGAALSIALVHSLKDQGNTEEASLALSGIKTGLADLQTRIVDGVDGFRMATETIVRLRQDWGGLMSPEQLEAATVKYVEDHPEVLSDFNTTYGELEKLGYLATRTELALNDPALKGLEGLEGYGDFVGPRNGFATKDETVIVTSESAPARDEITRAALLAETMDSDGAGKGRDNTAAIGNNVRNAVKETGNSYFILSSSTSTADAAEGFATGKSLPARTGEDIFRAGREVKLDPKKVTGFGGAMNGLGAAFSGVAAYSVADKLASGQGNFGDAVRGVYYSLGVVKEGGELMAVFIARGWLDRLGAGAGSQNAATSILASSNKDAGGLRKLPAHVAAQPGWVKFSSFLKLAGGGIDAAYAIKSGLEGDVPAAALYGTSATGGVFMSFASAGAIGSWGGPVGAGIVVLSAAGLMLYRDAQDKAKFEAPSREFLEAAGYDPEVASMLANYDNNDGQSAGPALAATARQFGVDPGTLMQRLNAMPAGKVEQLVNSAHTVNPNERGDYQLTAGNDRQVWGPEDKDPQYGGHYLYDPQDTAYRGGYDIVVGSPVPVANTDPNPHSMTALRDYARALMGEPVLG